MSKISRFFEWLRRTLITALGGYWDDSPWSHMYALTSHYIPWPVMQQCARAFDKVAKDPSFKDYEGANLGRNLLRDEGCEWAKLYLKDRRVTYRDSDVHLCMELLYHLRKRV